VATNRKYTLSIAGFDPSAGAGILADIKTFEQCGVYGLGVCTAVTIQNDVEFEKVDWLSAESILSQIKILLKRFKVEVEKIG
jgi:hydroxymethylpyrimidine/phosphomethylpyrimidine kinase